MTYDSKSFSNGIKWVFENYDRDDPLTIKAHNEISEDYSTDLVVNNYIKSYKKIITSS